MYRKYFELIFFKVLLILIVFFKYNIIKNDKEIFELIFKIYLKIVENFFQKKVKGILNLKIKKKKKNLDVLILKISLKKVIKEENIN